MELTNAIFTVHTLLFIAKPMKFFLRLIRKLEWLSVSFFPTLTLAVKQIIYCQLLLEF